MFAELLARSCFSFLRGASHPEEILKRAVELELGGVAICDFEGIYGAVRGHRAHGELDREGFRYAIGSEFSIEVEESDDERSGKSSLALLVETKRGYENLCRLLTWNHRAKDESALTLETLRDHTEGLFALWVAPERPDSDAAANARDRKIGRFLEENFAGRTAIAMYRYRDGFDRPRLRWALARAERFELEIVASSRPRYHRAEKKALYDVLFCIREGTTLESASESLDPNGERYLRSEAEMLTLFSDHPEWVERSGKILERLRFSFSELSYHFPCRLEPGESADERLRKLVREGVEKSYPEGIGPELEEQIERELALIAKIDVAPYFLSTRDVVEIARKRGILCQGRGSAANSAVCYVLGITAVDPSRSTLLFERFLSEERAEPPDIDVDFEHERREEVIQEIYARYGREQAAMVSEVICYRGKSALREVGKAFGLSLPQVETLSGLAGHYGTFELTEERLFEAGLDPRDARLRQVVALAVELRGIPRHLSIHVGGFVLSSRPLYEVAPVEAATMPGRTVIPWDKDDIETLGFFKVDVLGLGMLTAIRKTLDLVVRSGGLTPEGGEASEEGFDPIEVFRRIPKEDPLTYERIGRADTVGVFQIESRAQMSMLPRLKPKEFYDLVIEVAIVRPGPIQGGMVHPYLKRRSRKEGEEIEYPSKLLEKILERTLGVPLFQEQVMQIAIVGAGYTGGEADQLRRDMAAWKKSGKLLRHRERLLEGFRKNEISEEFGVALFEQIKGFGEYGFPESHASSFALLVYASAWLKTHYPAHFTCALLNSQPLGFYSPSTLIRDAQKHGVVVLDVSVLESEWDSKLEVIDKRTVKSRAVGAERALRLGFREIKGLSEESLRRFVEKREALRREGRSFSNVHELALTSGLSKSEVDTLALAGALGELSKSRREALFGATAPKTPGLFAEIPLIEPKVELKNESAAEQLVLDYASKGFSVSDHPLRYYRSRLKKAGVTRASDLLYLPKGTRVQVAGLVINRQRPATASGVVFMSLEDETGVANLVLWSDVFESFYRVAVGSPLLLVYGVIDRDDEKVPVFGTPEEDAPKTTIHVRVTSLVKLSKKTFENRKEPIEGTMGSSEEGRKEQLLMRLSRNFH